MPQDPNQPDAPPSYAVATGSSTSSRPQNPNNLQVPGAQNGIPPANRRSMEDEHRPLPEGWVRQWDAKEQHQFFVDTKGNPPRSIWHHPYDDDDYLKTLTSEQRERIQEEERQRQEHGHVDPSVKNTSNVAAQHSGSSSQFPQDLPDRPDHHDKHASGKPKFSERLKEKVTGRTKEERAEDRRKQEEEERQYYEAHLKFRQAMQQAQTTGQPAYLGKNRDGQEVFIEPPNMGGYAPYNNGYGYNPYSSGPYANPNARFVRPSYPYNRPYGAGYGGGYGLPVAGGLLGGMLLGGLLF